jgi:hypothetical protein
MRTPSRGPSRNDRNRAAFYLGGGKERWGNILSLVGPTLSGSPRPLRFTELGSTFARSRMTAGWQRPSGSFGRDGGRRTGAHAPRNAADLGRADPCLIETPKVEGSEADRTRLLRAASGDRQIVQECLSDCRELARVVDEVAREIPAPRPGSARRRRSRPGWGAYDHYVATLRAARPARVHG